MHKLLIIEDEPGLRMTLEDRFIAEGYNVTVKPDGITGESEAVTGDYDLILLDIMLPGRDGYKVCENIRKTGVDTPIIMTTARNTDLDTIIGFRQGADDYVSKPFDMGVLQARMEAVLRRSNASPKKENNENIYLFSHFKLDTEAGTLYEEGKEVHLNSQEYRLLEYMVKNPNKVISRDTLLDDIWGYDTDTTSRTVDVHIAKLRQRIGESDISKHIITVRGRGYKFIL